MKHANQDIRSIVTHLGYHKEEQPLSPYELESGSTSANTKMQKAEKKPAAVASEIMNDLTYLQNHIPLSEFQRNVFIAEHHDDIVPELFF